VKTWNGRAKAVFAQGGNTYSKMASQFVEGVYDTHYESFSGVDFVSGLGSNLIGNHNNFTLPSIYEVVLGEKIKALFPCIDKMKLVKTGSDACSAAVRIARAFTGREEVFGMGYHGWHDTFISAEIPGTGTLGRLQKYSKMSHQWELLSFLKDHCPAAVIIEPVQLDLEVKDFLLSLRKVCTEKGIVLIFDEVITGFRFPKYSVTNHFGITPDLICLGKALGNGYPIAIVGGREDIMETPGYFISNTHNGELSAINAALETLNYLTNDKLSELWDRGGGFLKRFNAMSPRLQLVGYPTRAELRGEDEYKAKFMQEMYYKGYLFGRAWFLNFNHTESRLHETLQAANDVIEQIDIGSVELKGIAPKPIFKRN